MFSSKVGIHVFGTLVAAILLAQSSVGRSGDLAIAVDASLLQNAMAIGGEQIVTPISKYANGVWTNGSAVTTADVQVAPWQNDGSLGLQLMMSSYTNGATFSQTLPRPSILVEFNASIQSWGSTSKIIGFAEGGFFTYPAQSQVQSSIEFGDLQSSAWGLFWRLKERIAYQRAYEELMNQKSQQEFEASQEVAGQLQSTVDQRSDGELSRLNQLYFSKIYQPYIASTALQGTMRFATENGRFLIGTGDVVAASQLPATNSLEPVAAQIGSGLIQTLVSRYVAGKQLTGEEVVRMLLPAGSDAGLEQDLDLNALRQISLLFAPQSAVTASTDEEGITLVFLLTRLRDSATTGENLKVAVRALISEEDGAIILDLDQPIGVEFAGGTPLSADLKQKLQAIVRKVIPAVSLDLKSKSFSIGGINLALNRLKASARGVSLGLNRSGSAGSANNSGAGNNPAGSLSSLCTQAGGTWRNGSECDCNRMWFTADAVAYYGANGFASQCRAYL